MLHVTCYSLLAPAYYQRPSAAWASVPAAVIEPFITAAAALNTTTLATGLLMKVSKIASTIVAPCRAIKQCFKCRPPPCHRLVPPSRRLVAQENAPVHFTSPSEEYHWCGCGWCGVCKGDVEDKQCPALLMASRHTPASSALPAPAHLSGSVQSVDTAGCPLPKSIVMKVPGC